MFAPGRSSSIVNVRPSTSETPNVSKEVGGDDVHEDATRVAFGQPAQREGVRGERREHVRPLAQVDVVRIRESAIGVRLDRVAAEELRDDVGRSPGRGFSSRALTMLNTAVFAPIPSASTATATTVKLRWRLKSRSPKRRSWSQEVIRIASSICRPAIGRKCCV